MDMRMSIDAERITAYIFGEMDHHSTGIYREEIDDIVNQTLPKCKMLVLDFGGVTFMDSSGIGFVMGRYKTMNEIDGQLRVVNLHPLFKRMMRMAGLDKLGIFGDTGR